MDKIDYSCIKRGALWYKVELFNHCLVWDVVYIRCNTKTTNNIFLSLSAFPLVQNYDSPRRCPAGSALDPICGVRDLEQGSTCSLEARSPCQGPMGLAFKSVSHGPKKNLVLGKNKRIVLYSNRFRALLRWLLFCFAFNLYLFIANLSYPDTLRSPCLMT